MSVSAISHYPREKCTHQAGHRAKNVSESFLTPSSPIHLMNVTRAERSEALGCFIQVIQRGRMPFIAATWIQLEYCLYLRGNAFLAVRTDIGKLQIQELTQEISVKNKKSLDLVNSPNAFRYHLKIMKYDHEK